MRLNPSRFLRAILKIKDLDQPYFSSTEMVGKIVLTTGAFDMLHPGHIRLLEEAKKLAGSDGKLVVLIARDETVRRNKGRDPIFDEESRRYMVSMLKPVDEVILGYTPPSFEKVIERVKPDIVVFGCLLYTSDAADE